MPIISVKDNKNVRWERNSKNKTNQNKTKNRTMEREAIANFGFLQLIFKASLIFKSNLELALSINLKERELYESKHVAVQCRCLKIGGMISFLTCSSILILKWRQVLPI